MTHQIQGNDSGIFIVTESSKLHPDIKSNFTIGDKVFIEYIADQKVILTDISVETENPYQETWIVTWTALQPLVAEKKIAINFNINKNIDYIELILFTLLIMTSFWMIYIFIKVI
jgi:hypothetical protein